MSRVRVNLVVTGLVQGVFFRQSALQEAQRLGLCGWAMNLADGSVEIEAEGEQEAVEAFAGWARCGPPAARVDGVAQRRMPPTGADRTFRIRR